ncbi:MarR family winged helix-turn-helix transcriptional regulator [Martelella alba]|uniref:MarR family winged helix-turn-helix transcriptional regulator n=1 Tax=Martelella alba TaxID=2590451 RepID=UPI001F421BBF|nr:MarR family transcriptional regulator [Martelella alba]
MNQALERNAETQLKQHALSIEQFRVLTALNETNGISMGALAARISMDSPTLTKLIDRMVSSADVYRGPDPRDRRKVLVFISNKGLTTYEALADIHDQQQQMLLDTLGEQKLAMLELALNDIIEAANTAASPDKISGDLAAQKRARIARLS